MPSELEVLDDPPEMCGFRTSTVTTEVASKWRIHRPVLSSRTVVGILRPKLWPSVLTHSELLRVSETRF
jgi:hypothetical protein